MKQFWPILNLFIAGANTDRLLNGEVEHFFGTHWLLLAFTVSSLALGCAQVIRLANPQFGVVSR